MVTIDHINGLRVVIYTNDHRHVHVVGAEFEAVFDLNCPKGPPVVRENYGFRSGTLKAIEEALAEKLAHYCAEWRRIHGQ